MVVPRELLHKVGYEANIGFSLQAYYKGRSAAESAGFVAFVRLSFRIHSSNRHPMMRTCQA
jgi:hypothetical protein